MRLQALDCGLIEKIADAIKSVALRSFIQGKFSRSFEIFLFLHLPFDKS